MKLAISLDGKIATRTGDSRWVSGPESLARAHELRHEYDAIMIGAGTAALDDPLLTDRSGLPRRRALVRVVVGDRSRLSPESQLVRTAAEGAPLLVLGGDLTSILKDLADRSLQSVLLEGGAALAGKFFDAGLVNKVTFFVAPKIVGGASHRARSAARASRRWPRRSSSNECASSNEAKIWRSPVIRATQKDEPSSVKTAGPTFPQRPGELFNA